MTESDDQPAWRSVEQAVRDTLAALAEVSPVHGALTEMALSLAQSLDMRASLVSAQAGLASAALARELRSTLEVLAKGVGDDDNDAVAKLMAHFGSPVSTEVRNT